MTNETVGEKFQADLLREARDRSLEVLFELTRRVRPGMSEDETKKILKEIQPQKGMPKSWHAPQIRFGENTLLPFGEKGVPDLRLKETDIFFLDLGPLYEEHEGDVGRTFAVGGDAEMIRCASDVEKIWHDVRNHWYAAQPTGRELYEFALTQAREKGWIMTLEGANGHRVADFPHTIRNRGSVEEFLHSPAPDRWILEIQIRHPERPFGAFFEDLLV